MSCLNVLVLILPLPQIGKAARCPYKSLSLSLSCLTVLFLALSRCPCPCPVSPADWKGSSVLVLVFVLALSRCPCPVSLSRCPCPVSLSLSLPCLAVLVLSLPQIGKAACLPVALSVSRLSTRPVLTNFSVTSRLQKHSLSPRTFSRRLSRAWLLGGEAGGGELILLISRYAESVND